MPNEYNVKITQQAQNQLSEIVAYISSTLQAPETAKGTLDTLRREIISLKEFPNRVPLVDEEPWRAQGIHKLGVKNYLVYYWVDDVAKKVQVFAVVYARRDQRRFLSELDIR